MTIKMEFLGAQDTVTGSRTLIHFRDKRVLVDCGLFQGIKEIKSRNWAPFPFPPQDIDTVLLTHAHLDHCGYLPRLYREGFRGKIICTSGTKDLVEIVLRDAAYIEEETASFANKTGYSHHKPALPLFTKQDVEDVLKLIGTEDRGQWSELFPGLSVRFERAGHIIGSSIIQLAFEDHEHSRTFTFSGDLGGDRSLLLKPPATIRQTDALILESTYGNRLHPEVDVTDELERIINKVAKRSGVMVIPSFAIGRSQEIIRLIKLLENQGRIPQIPVILDSPMSEAALKICENHTEDQTLESPFNEFSSWLPAKFEISRTSDDSMLACMRDGPMIVISASGMLTGGRILHHLKHRLPAEENLVLFTGFQADGTKGRHLQDQGEIDGVIRIHHEEIPVNAEVQTLDALSAHADYEEMMNWVEQMNPVPQLIILNHGSENAQTEFARKLEARFKTKVVPVCKQKSFNFSSDKKNLVPRSSHV